MDSIEGSGGVVPDGAQAIGGCGGRYFKDRFWIMLRYSGRRPRALLDSL